MKIFATLALAATASAFQSASKPSARSSVAVQESKADLEAMAKKLNPIVGFYDPLVSCLLCFQKTNLKGIVSDTL